MKGETGNFEGSPCPNVSVHPIFKQLFMPIYSLIIFLGAVVIGQVYFIAKVYPGSMGLVCISTSDI